MLKTFLLAAFVANVVLTVSSTGTGSPCGGRPHERWVQCPFDCAPKNCSQLGYPVLCPVQGKDGRCPSKPGCVCENGYLRDDKGYCIPQKHCPSCGGDENAQSGCGTCPRTCKNYNSTEPQICTLQCNLNGCDCKKGYVLDQNTKKCVLPKDCTPTCGSNEVFDTCINGGCHAGRTCDQLESLNGSTICVYPKVCQQGCLCKEGYYRNSKGICVPEKECPCRKCGGRPNEKYVECPSCAPKNCSEVGYLIPCPVNPDVSCPTKPGCVCNDGYVRNEKGLCVSIKTCPSCGGDKNAESGCGNCPKTCQNYNSTEPIYCIQICYPNACNCKKGFVLDVNLKKCVRPENCTPTCGPDEVFNTCANGGCHSGRTCTQYENLNGAIICVDPIKCKPGCLCKKGYYRNNDGVCVPANQCPKQCGGRPNEQYVPCPDECTPQKCSQLGYPIACSGITADGSCPSKPGCICDDGFVRDEQGKCIPVEECPSCGGDENAQKGCANCPTTCKNYNSTEPQICPLYCELNGCDCKQGFVLDENLKKCVRSENCTATCGPDEVLNTCANGGCHSGRTCTEYENFNGAIICYAPLKCEPGCVCKEGYYRNNDGVCIPADQCPKQCDGRPNEQYVPCPDQCTPQKCSQLGYPIACPAISEDGSCPSKPGCICDDGFVRDEQGICIPVENCPSCGGDENAQKGCANCPTTCKNYNSTEPQICPLYCELNGCDCKQGFVLDENLKKCVRSENCTATCGPDEVFDTCANGGCHSGRTCTQYENFNGAIICVDPIKCEPGCLCKEGYYRNNDGVCVPANECPKQCNGRPNEQYVPCPDECIPQKCSQLGYPIACPAISEDGSCPSKPGCICDDGFARDEQGICIPVEQCPSCGGDENAQKGCANCPTTCKNYNSTEPQICPLYCELNGCDCKQGFVLDENLKKCVRSENCTATCGPDEVFDTCANGGCHSGRTCTQYENFNGAIICVDPIKCEPGCLCKEGYYRNNDGVCVPANQCPKQCNGRPNEQYVPCPDECIPQKCSQLGYPIACPAISEDGSCPSKPGCICDDGFARDEQGICIPVEQCPSCGGDENAQKGCANCPTTCTNYNSTEPQICLQYCEVNGCDCKQGFVLDENLNKCVLSKDCSPKCGPDEVFDSCSNGGCHSGRTCKDLETLNGNTICVDPIRCIPGCLCREGYYRNSDGVCVPAKECPSSCGPNEVYDTCVNGRCHGPKTCKDLDNFNGSTICDYYIECQSGCACKDGYLRNHKGVCVPENKCPNSKCKGNFETYVPCNYQCTPETCDQLGFSRYCLLPAPGPSCPGKSACLCRAGYLRNRKGKCIPIDQCPSCGGDPNAKSGCGMHCGRSCSDYFKAPVACPAICVLNGCDCKDNYVYDRNIGKCVLPEKCTPICGQYEKYSTCKENSLERKCGQPPSENNRSLRPKHCTAGCVCQDGYYRNSNGVCVTKNGCNDQCSGKPNEFWDECPPNCLAETCASIGQVKECPIQPAVCRPRCRCAQGFYRDDKGVCVPERQCYQCGKNEVFDKCVTTCPPRKCGKSDAVLCAPTNPDDCKAGCRCQDGYHRNNQGECVTWEMCPPETTCTKDNEVYDECPSKCPPRVCGVDDRLIDCAPQPLPGDPKCPEPACICAYGFYRDAVGQCVKWEDCTICPKGELYDPCPNPCPPQLCSVDERVIRCKAPPQLGDPECKPECRCPDGYKRDDKGVCIPKEQCLPFCYGENEVADPCPDPCDPNTCESIDKKYHCPLKNNNVKQCQPACRCKPGFYRNKLGQCISKENCLKCTKLHEYYSCGGACDNVCSTMSQQNQTNCPIINIKCNEMCYCEEGYARDRQGNCVPISSCRSCKGEHEWYDTCTPNCPSTDSCDSYGKENLPSVCKASCRCEDNYLRNKNGDCIPQEQCQSCNGDPNAKPGCGCSKTCSDFYANKPPLCTKICKINACDCKEDYVLDEKSGKCVLPKNCPAQAQCPKNEVFDQCPATCPPETCPDGRLYRCLAPPKPGSKECKARCRCEKGYYRNKNGICIPKEQCPPVKKWS